MNITVLGAGSWGTSMAIHLSNIGHTVQLVSRTMEHALEMASAYENKKYLPGVVWKKSLQISCELLPAIMECEVIVIACPSKGIRPLLEQLQPVLSHAAQLKCFLSLSKGIEKDTCLTPVEVMKEVLPEYQHGVLTGPTYAKEVAIGKPTAMVLAGTFDSDYAQYLQDNFSSNSLRIYHSEDLHGVELASCLKNVYAIAAGICEGLQLGDNARASLMTRSLAEMVRVGVCLGGQPETFYGLSGFGDLLATATGAWSRNRTFGEKIGKGVSAEQLIHEAVNVVEGYFTTAHFYKLLKDEELDAPILDQIYGVLYEQLAPQKALQLLMQREQKKEG